MDAELKTITKALTRIADALDTQGDQTFAARLVHEVTGIHDQLCKFGPTLAVLDLGVVKLCESLDGIAFAITSTEHRSET